MAAFTIFLSISHENPKLNAHTGQKLGGEFCAFRQKSAHAVNEETCNAKSKCKSTAACNKVHIQELLVAALLQIK
jgi:hypothetical protein